MLDQLENNYHNYEKTENSKKKYSRVRSALNLFTVFSHENVNFFAFGMFSTFTFRTGNLHNTNCNYL